MASPIRRFYFTTALLAIFPILLWLIIRPFSDRFLNINVTTTSLGQIAGITGYCLYAVTIILSSRLKIIEKHFRGLDKVYSEHHILGQLTLILLLLHPLLLSIKYLLSSASAAMNFFMPSFDSLPSSLGIISLDTLIIALFFTLYYSLRYHVWKQTHRLTTAAFIVGFIHTLLIYSDTSQSVALKTYLLILGGLAIIIGISRFFGVLTIKKTRAIVSHINTKNDVFEIYFRPEKQFNFSAGQFAFISFDGQYKESHPFSFISSSKNSEVGFAIKKLGDYTKALTEIKPGQAATIEGPYGGFTQDKVKTNNQIWIAGGIGVTPFLSLLKDLPETINTNMFLSVGQKNETFCLDEIASLSQGKDNFRFYLHESSTKGFISAEKIQQDIRFNPSDLTVMICGPTGMMKALKSQFMHIGVPEERIIFEDFAL